MITGIYCHNGSSALHRPLPIAGALALRGQTALCRPPRHPRSRPHLITIPQRRDVIRRFIDRLSPSRATATRQIPIAV
jgi:hypothetical protein